MSGIPLDECPTCQARGIQIENKQGVLVGTCGCWFTPLQVRNLTDRSKSEVYAL